MNFYTNNLSTARMSIDTNGYVGINTSPSSSYQLDVNGGIRGSSVRTYHYYYSDSHDVFQTYYQAIICILRQIIQLE